MIQNFSHRVHYNLPIHIQKNLIKYAEKHGKAVDRRKLPRGRSYSFNHTSFQNTESILLFYRGKIYVDVSLSPEIKYRVLDKLPGPLEMMIVMSMTPQKNNP